MKILLLLGMTERKYCFGLSDELHDLDYKFSSVQQLKEKHVVGFSSALAGKITESQHD